MELSAAPPGSARNSMDAGRDIVIGALLLLIPVLLRICLRLDAHVFAWLWGASFLCYSVSVPFLRHERMRNAVVSAAAAFAALCCLEVGLTLTTDNGFADQGGSARGFTVHGGPLGYGPRPGARVRSRRILNGRTVFDVTYTIDDQGHRTTPGSRSDGDTILFFGCSFTFGQGVNDDQTLPAYFARRTSFQYHVVNLGYSGYGAHQMLRSLELDLPRTAISGKVRGVVFQAASFQIPRSAGMSSWDLRGPRYALDGGGRLITRSSQPSLAYNFLDRAVGGSRIFSLSVQGIDNLRYRQNEATELYAAIIEEAGSIVRRRYGIPLTLLYWDINLQGASALNPAEKALHESLVQRFTVEGMRIVRVSAQIPAYSEKYSIAGDRHPTPYAHSLNAAAVARSLSVESNEAPPWT